MARQKGALQLSGTITNNTYYQLNGQHLVRRKSSLTKQQVTTSPAFANSRKASAVFGHAAAIAGAVYKNMPTTKRKHGLIDKLTGMANKLLREGKREEEVRE